MNIGAVLLLGFFSVLVGGLVFFFGRRTFFQVLLPLKGASTRGQVSAINTRRYTVGWLRLRYYEVTLSFSAHGTPYTTTSLGAVSVKHLSQGETTPIYYWKSNPKKAVTAVNNRRNAGVNGLLFLFSLLLAGVMIRVILSFF